MPRKKKEEELTQENTVIEVTPKKRATSKAKKENNKKIAKTESSKRTTRKTTKTTTKSTTKKTTKRSTRVATKTATATSKRATKKISTSSSAKKATRRTTVSKAKLSKSKAKLPSIEVIEYYDLPYRYNQTVVKVLYQTPTTLFIYWDISDDDRNAFVEKYGDNFFNDTKPVLIVHNDTMHYSFEIEINDFANSWYLHVNDSNCRYAVELGRRPIYYNNTEKHIDVPNDYVYVSYSNEIESPNDHVLFNKNINTVYFKDVKTNIITAESITSLSFIRNMGRIYSLYDLYTNFNKDSWMDKNKWCLDLRSPSSSNPSSTFK